MKIFQLKINIPPSLNKGQIIAIANNKKVYTIDKGKVSQTYLTIAIGKYLIYLTKFTDYMEFIEEI